MPGALLYFEQRKLAVANRFANRPILSWNGSTYYANDCLNPGEQKSGGPFKGSLALYIGLAGTRCAR